MKNTGTKPNNILLNNNKYFCLNIHLKTKYESIVLNIEPYPSWHDSCWTINFFGGF
jgi:hypothetical protein